MTSPHHWANFALQRPNYFPGQYLLAEDFELAHRYLSDRQRYINSRLHLSGIVAGLEVDAIAGQAEVLIRSGSAIDGEGNLIVVPEAITHSINIAANQVAWLCLRYQQELTLLQQPEIPDSFTRFAEIPLVTLEAVPPQDETAVLLATIRLDQGQVLIDNAVRHYSGVRLPSGAGEILLNNQESSLSLKGQLSILGALELGGTNITAISESIDLSSDRPHVLPSEKAVKAHLENRLIEQLASLNIPTQEKPAISNAPGPDGKLYGWEIASGEPADPSAVIKLLAYQAGEAISRVTLERDTGKVEVNGKIQVQHFQSSNPMQHQMYPEDPEVYQNIFAAKDSGAITKTPTGEPAGYSENLSPWCDRQVICFGTKDSNDRGALISIPADYSTVWVRVQGDRYYEFKADLLDGVKEDLGRWTGGRRCGNCYCPDGSLSDGYSFSSTHHWLSIPIGRQEGGGKLRLIDKSGSRGNGGLLFTGLGFSKNPWAHATQSALGYHWAVNGGTATGWNSASGQSDGFYGDIFSYMEPGGQSELQVPYVWSGRDKLLYLIEFNLDGSNGCGHTGITVNNTPIERLLGTYDNPFARHWGNKVANRYIAARIPAELIPKPSADSPPVLTVKFDLSMQDSRIHFREVGTHDLEVPAYP